MADIKKCDRCGKTYEPYPKDFDKLCVCTRKKSSLGAVLRIEQDLCMDCLKDLDEFMNPKKPEETEEQYLKRNKFGPFTSRYMAEMFVTAIVLGINDKGYVTVAEACALADMSTSSYRDISYGWDISNFHALRIISNDSGYNVAMPKAKRLNLTAKDVVKCGAKYDCKPTKE